MTTAVLSGSVWVVGAALLTVALPGGATAEQPRPAPEQLPGPGVVLTFDDRSVANWVRALPLFSRYGARVTFFIDHWDKLSSQQLRGLEKLVAAGHAVGCHGLRHRKAVEYSRTHSMAQYLADEIAPAVKLMRRAGFDPTCFAYPCSQHNADTDTALLEVFRRLRSGCGRGKGRRLVQLTPIFTPLDRIKDRGCLIGTCVQPHTADAPLIAEVAEAFRRVKKRREVVVFYAHDIRPEGAPGPANYITPDALEAILRSARADGLRFFTFDDLP
ncbi:MAG: polysaccharide deacetylase family protein [Kiritimatiellaeota bacterium]|nr:polysaccharide deacetylase family protein [Kiritimatiellota bacterium]